MAINAAKGYVVPAGVGVLKGIFGPQFDQNNWPSPAQGMFDTGDGRGAYGAPTDAWNAYRLGYGTLDAPEALQAGMLEARGRYLGGPNNASWSDRWDQWNATDVVGPDGKTLLSPVHQTGLRVGQDYGARGADGQVAGPAGGDIFQGFTWTQNQLRNNPYLDPTNQLAGFRGMAQSSPYAMPNAGDYTSTMQRAQGGPGQADFYGQRGIEQTNALAEANLRQLTRGIDRETEETLATELPGIQHAMEAAGLGRSGAGQLQMQQTMRDVMAQSNRDKQRVMADYTDREANRQAGAINLGSQIGAQGYEGYAGRQGAAALAGLGDTFAANQSRRDSEQAMWQQTMDRENQRYGMDTGNYLTALQAGGQYQLGALEQERLGQSASLQDWLGLQANRNQTQADSLQQYLQTSNAYRGIEQERLNQMLQAGMMPLDLMMRIATGTTAPAGPSPGRPSFWENIGGQAVGGVAQGAGNMMADYMGGFMS